MRKLLIVLPSFLLLACSKEPAAPWPTAVDLAAELLDVPAGFEEIPFPEDNPFSVDKWKMGKRLFFDPRLSRDGSIHCGSCHKAEFGFADDVPVSPGVDNVLGTRNSPSIANVAYLPYFMREGGVPTLEQQILVPIQEHAEFDNNILEIVELLKTDSTYARMSSEAFDRSFDAYVLTRSIATFERTLISGNSKYDQAQRNEVALSASESRGKDLFFSDRTSCSSCHEGVLFSDHSFQNTGLYAEYQDPGRFRFTQDSADLALFRVPSLRNVELSYPYMHNGEWNSLKEIVLHYNEGGNGHPNQSSLVRPLGLSDSEVDDIVAFLRTLTDPSFTTNEHYHEEK